MMSRFAQPLRNHIHVLIIVPLFVIATTWPTFPRIFDADGFWLHGMHEDKWLRLWDVWHFERALTGQSPLYYTDSLFHPQGTSLAFYSLVFPHALLMIALKAVIPVDAAYNLLFLLILCFNGFSGYALIRHLTKDKWIALFGAVVVAVATPYPKSQTVPDLITTGTLPLTLYFLIRSITESNWRFAILAGLCAGVTAFIGVYVWAILLLTVAILALIESFSLWRKKAFWRGLIIFFTVCGLTSVVRFYPMLLNPASLNQAYERYQYRSRSNDVLEFVVLSNNPITGRFFGGPLDPSDDYENSIIRKEYKEAYLGYINLILIACAFVFSQRRRRLLLWSVILVFFVILRLGPYLTFNNIHYEDIGLPQYVFETAFPLVFQNISSTEYYQIGVITPLAVLACYGLAALLRSKPAKTRILVVLFCALVVSIEFTTPRIGQAIERQATDFVAWLQSQPDEQVKLVHLPLEDGPISYYAYLQTLTGYPQVNGNSSRLKASAHRYIYSNYLLATWKSSRSVHCLNYNEPSFTAALDQLLADGFTHIVLHKWLYGDEFIIQTFMNVPPAYDNGYVSVYRLRDLRLSCQNQAAELPRFIHLAQSESAAPGSRSAILSIHPDQAIDADLFDYLGSLFSDWRSLLHLYLYDGELVMQSAGLRYADLETFTNENQVIHLLYNALEADTDLLKSHVNLDGFNLCQRQAYDDGAVLELYVSRDFACELVTAGDPFEVRYDNGARLENLAIETSKDEVDLQLRWSNLPDDAYSVSIQVFDASGEKVLGQDAVIGHVTLDRHRLDVSSLPAGDYIVKLIMYSFDSGAIVSGTVSGDGTRIDRALDIASIHRP